MANFELAIPVILKHEGGYVNHPDDPGGETNFGITKRSYPKVNIRNLTEAEAKEIYYRDYWDRFKYGGINDQVLATKVFDMCVNMGPKQAHILLQQAVNEVTGLQMLKVDGIFGARTLAEVNEVNPERLLNALRNQMADFYRALARNKPNLAKFLRGWLNRAAE